MKQTFSIRLSNMLIVLWVFLLPLQTRLFLHQGTLAGGLWEYGTASIYLTDLLLLSAVLALLFSPKVRLGGLPKRIPRTLVAALYAVLLTALLSLISSVDIGIAAAAFLRLAAGFVAWWLVTASELSPAALSWTVIASASVQGALAIVQMVQQAVPASTLFGMAVHVPEVAGTAVVETVGGRFLRAYGTLPHPNMLGGWLAFGLILCTGLYLRTHQPMRRVGLLGLFLLMQMGLLLTFSRTAVLTWILVFLGLTLAVFIREYGQHRTGWAILRGGGDDPFLGLKMLKLVIASVLLMATFSALFAPLIRVRTAETGRLEERSVQERLTQVNEALSLFWANPLIGVGIGNYTKALYEQVDSTRTSWQYQPVHNVYLLLLAELGVIGTLVFVWAIVVIVTISLRVHREHWRRVQPHGIPWVAISGMALLALFLMSFLEHYFWTLQFGVMGTWLAIGLWTKSLFTTT